MHTNKTAILIFARSAQNEAQHKRLHLGLSVSHNAELARALNNKVINTCTESNIPYFIVDQSQQVGSEFGERLENAFRLVYSKGYENVIAVGNDCPDLTVNDLLLTKTSVETGNAVLGPSIDGGVYLIGLNRQVFDSIQGTKISWKTTSVFDQLQDTIKSPIEYLSHKLDIDEGVNEKILKVTSRWTLAFWRLILSLLDQVQPKPTYAIVPSKEVATSDTLRGPPQHFSF